MLGKKVLRKKRNMLVTSISSFLLMFLTHYHIIPHFDALKIYSFGKHRENRRNCLQQTISPFVTMFSTLSGTYFLFSTCFEMSSAICFNLDQSNILSSGNGLKDFFLKVKKLFGKGKTIYNKLVLHRFEFYKSNKTVLYLFLDFLF